MVDLLQEDKNLDKLLQILFGPVINVKPDDEDLFLKYGFIKLAQTDDFLKYGLKANSQAKYVAFSGHSHAFLNLFERETGFVADLWPIWRDTEKALRHLITTTMLNQYGERWVEKLEKARPNLKKIFDECRAAQQKEEKSFGSRASQNLIDFTYPQDLFAIVFAEWNSFKSIFGKDKNYWDGRAQLLAKIRNPLAHNRDESFYEYERQIAEGYCNEILTLVKVP